MRRQLNRYECTERCLSSGGTTSQFAILLFRSTRGVSLLGFLVLPVHPHVLSREYACEGTSVVKFAVSLDEPSAGFLLLRPLKFDATVREGTWRSGSTSPKLVEFAGHMRGPSLNYIEKKKKSEICTLPVTEASTFESFSALILLFLHLYLGAYCDPIPGNSLGWRAR